MAYTITYEYYSLSTILLKYYVHEISTKIDNYYYRSKLSNNSRSTL